MGQNKTDKSPYLSRFGGGWISGAQWLAENMCSRKYRSQHGGDLPTKFWQDKYWEKELRLQIKHANDLLKEFDIEVILACLKHPDAKRLYSLGLKSVLVPLMKREQNHRKFQQVQQKENATKIEAVDVTQKPRQPFARKKSHLQRLRELDNGEEKS